jgi:hypothetical protein
LTRLLASEGWLEAEPANWRWSILSMNPDSTEFNLPLLKRDYLGHADILLLHKLGGDPSKQETIRLWDSGVRLAPGGQAVYLGQVTTEVLVQRMKVFSYWSAIPVSQTYLEQLFNEPEGMQVRWEDNSFLLIRNTQVSPDS